MTRKHKNAWLHSSLRKIFIILAAFMLVSCQGTQTGAVYQKDMPLLPTLIATAQATPTASATAAPSTPTSAPIATGVKPTSIIEPAAPPPPATPVPAGYVYYPPGRITVPVLLYHNVSDQGSSRYTVRPAQFRAQMKHLHETGYQAVTISQLTGVIRNGGWLPEQPVVITFDDGYLGVFQNAFPILAEFGFPAVVYLITGTLGTDLAYGYLQEDQIITLAAAGWEIGSHSSSHSNLKTTRLGLQDEIESSKQALEEMLDLPVRSFSYPYNITSAAIREQVQQAGYESGVGVDSFVTHSSERLYFISRREVFRSTTTKEFLALLVPTKYEIASQPHTPDAP